MPPEPHDTQAENQDEEKLGAREIRSPLQAWVRVLLGLLALAVLVGFVLALVRFFSGEVPEETHAAPPAHVSLLHAEEHG